MVIPNSPFATNTKVRYNKDIKKLIKMKEIPKNFMGCPVCGADDCDCTFAEWYNNKE